MVRTKMINGTAYTSIIPETMMKHVASILKEGTCNAVSCTGCPLSCRMKNTLLSIEYRQALLMKEVQSWLHQYDVTKQDLFPYLF